MGKQVSRKIEKIDEQFHISNFLCRLTYAYAFYAYYFRFPYTVIVVTRPDGAPSTVPATTTLLVTTVQLLESPTLE